MRCVIELWRWITVLQSSKAEHSRVFFFFRVFRGGWGGEGGSHVILRSMFRYPSIHAMSTLDFCVRVCLLHMIEHIHARTGVDWMLYDSSYFEM